MPLAVGSLVTQPTPPRPQLPDVGTIRAVWYAPDGTQWLLTPPLDVDYGWLTGPGIAGWGAPPVTVTADAHPRGGSRVRHRRAESRTITWPMHVYGSTHTQLLERRRALTEAFTQTLWLGPGVLRVERPDGSYREIVAEYVDGAQGTAGEDWLHANLVIQLLCEDPWWLGPDVSDFRAYATAPSPFLNPFMTIAGTQVLGSTTIFNPGSVEAWPVWTITGPATEVVATNTTTGEAWTLTPEGLGAGETATVTTDPPSVRGPAGEVWTGLLDWPTSVLWGLQKGSNDVTFAVAGAEAGTRISWTYRARYDTA